MTTYRTAFYWLSITYYVKEVVVFACVFQVKMALVNFTCQVCILWLKVIDGEVKIAVSSFSAQHGMIILPLRAILARVYVHHMGKTPHSWPVGVHWDGSLIATSMQHALKNAVDRNKRAHMLCVCGKSWVWEALLWKAVDLIEMRREGKDVLFSPHWMKSC